MSRKNNPLFPAAALPAFLGFLLVVGLAVLLLGGPAKADDGLVTVCPKETMAWVLVHTWRYEPGEFSKAFEYFVYGSSAQRQSCNVMDSDVFDLSEGRVVGMKIIAAAVGENQFRRELAMAEVEIDGETEYALFER